MPDIESMFLCDWIIFQLLVYWYCWLNVKSNISSTVGHR